MRRIVHLVTDWDTADAAIEDALRRLRAAIPAEPICLEVVPAHDTLAAGRSVAQLAMADGPPGRMVVHDVAPGDGDPAVWPGGEAEDFCVARSATGTLIVGATAGWAWSFAVEALKALYRLDVRPGRRRSPMRDGLPLAVAHVHAGHPHAVTGVVPRASVPAVPQVDPALRVRAPRTRVPQPVRR